MTTLHTVTGTFADLAGAHAAGSGSVVAGGQVDGAWRTIGQYVDTEGDVIRLPAVDVTLDSSGRLTTAAGASLQLPETSGEWGYLLTLHVQGVERRYYFELTDDVDLADVADSTPIDMDLLPTWEALSARIGALEELPPGSYDDTEVRALVTTEATTRAAADIALGGRIDQEAAARATAISTAINALIGMAPAELDTLKEVADAIAAGNSTDAALLAAINNRALIDHTHDAADLTGIVKTVNGTGPDGNGNVIVSARLYGTGFPEGVVAAPAGTEYVDEASTNGASVWLKVTGTGNTGWVVIVGKTTWRDVQSLVTNRAGSLLNNRVRVRRRVDVVEVWWPRVAGAGQMTLTLPPGFRLPSHLAPTYTNDVAWPLTYRDPGNDTGISVGHIAFLDASTIYCRATAGFDNRGANFSYPVESQWPTGDLFGNPIT